MHLSLFVCLALGVSLGHAHASRPKAEGPTPPAVRAAAWQQHQRMEQASPARALRWRSIGPTVQGGRVVDVEMVPGQPASFYVAYASGNAKAKELITREFPAHYRQAIEEYYERLFETAG